MKPETKEILKELEALDDNFRENGISDEYKEKWDVTNNVGLWICGPEAGAYLHSEILKRKPISILELGTSVGYSTIWMADAAVEVGGHVVSIEKADFKVREARENLKNAGLLNVEVMEGDIHEILEEWNAPVDLVFMDANKRGYLKQFELLAPHLTENAVVIADNINDMREQVQDFVDYFKDSDWNMEILDIAHGLAVVERA